MEKLVLDYKSFLVSDIPDLCVNLNIRDRLRVSEIKYLLPYLRACQEGDRYYTDPELIECRIKWGKATLEVTTERNIFAPEVEYKLFNILLHGLYSGIFRKLRKTAFDNFLLHGCGVVDNDRCFLFTGPSGSGKTTVASLAGDRMILNDEAVLIGRNDEGFCLSGTPFDGGVQERNNLQHHLSTIFFLKHGREVKLRKLSQVETYKRLLTQVFDTSPLFELPDRNSFTEQAGICSEVVSKVPSYELAFLPDSSFWRHIETIIGE
jgi:hypothetical protein